LDADDAKLPYKIMNGRTEKTFAEFFAGIGLMRIGLDKLK
jgi:hypothetical protein